MAQTARKTTLAHPAPRAGQADANETQQAPLWELAGPAPISAADTPTPAGASGDVQIERLILHHLDNRADRMELVDEVAQLDARSETFFVSHILAAARRADWFASFDDPACEVAALCQQLIDQPVAAHDAALMDMVGANHDATTDDGVSPAFVAASQRLAQRLFEQMRRRQKIAPGDFVAIVYTADGRPQRHVALLKLDPDQRLIRTFERIGGRMRVTITTAGNLLPETVRLQKCALLTVHEGRPDLLITLLDNQAGKNSEGVASFFFRGFLAATLTPSARRYTRLFLVACDTWLMDASSQMSPVDLLRFYRARRDALLGEEVNIAAFAAAALPTHPALRDDLLRTLTAGLFDGAQPAPADATFPVERAIADPLTQTVTLELDGGATIKVDAERFAAFVKVAEQRTGENAFHLEIDSLTLREVSR